MTLKPNQVRAARALLEWSQEELAHHADLARITIVNFEAGLHKANTSTIKQIKDAFDKNHIEFIEDEGVRRKTESITVYNGTKDGLEFFDFVLNYMQSNKGFLYIGNIDWADYIQHFPTFTETKYYKGIIELSDQIDLKRLRYTRDRNNPIVEYGEWRVLPEEDKGAGITFYVFGDYIAIILFLDEPLIFLIQNKQTTLLYTEKFLAQWKIARLPNLSKKLR